jgi:SulP family sulfate permease
MAGIILILFGTFRLGSVVQYIPQPVTIGFTAGMAAIIFSGQIGYFLGLEIHKQEAAFLAKIKTIFLSLHTFDPHNLFTACLSLGVILLTLKLWPRLPWALLGMLVSTLIAYFFFRGKVDTIGSVFGGFPQTFPSFQWLPFSEMNWTDLLVPALLIAVVCSIESLLSAHVADRITGDKHNSNRELVGQGIANLVTPFFAGIPASGGISRTATNIRSGAMSPISGMVHSLFVLLVLLFFAPYAVHIPLASMAPILMMIAWNMSQSEEFKKLLRMKSGDSLVLCITFFATVLIDIPTGVISGIATSLILFILRIGRCQIIAEEHDLSEKIGIYRLEGPLYFGSVKQLVDTLRSTPEHQIIILRLDRVPYLDSSAEDTLRNLIVEFQQHDRQLWITGLSNQPQETLRRSGLWEQKPHFFFHGSFSKVLSQARLQLQESK